MSMTLEEIESIELTDEFIEQVQQEATPENIARITLLTARMLLDYCDGDRGAAVEEAQRDCQKYTLVYGSRPRTFSALLKAIDVLADFRAKKAANAPTDQSEALTAHNTPKTGCQVHCTTESGGKQGVGA